MYVKPPIFTLCVGNAWKEAALLLAAGAKGNRSALPSSTIMIKQANCKVSRPSYRRGPCKEGSKECEGRIGIRKEAPVNANYSLSILKVKLYSKHIGKSPEEIEADIMRRKYFSPSEAVEYGIIDKVLYNERSHEDRAVVADLKKAQPYLIVSKSGT
ncbi:unnamed protein product [Camellia sinensis]